MKAFFILLFTGVFLMFFFTVFGTAFSFGAGGGTISIFSNEAYSQEGDAIAVQGDGNTTYADPVSNPPDIVNNDPYGGAIVLIIMGLIFGGIIFSFFAGGIGGPRTPHALDESPRYIIVDQGSDLNMLDAPKENEPRRYGPP